MLPNLETEPYIFSELLYASEDEDYCSVCVEDFDVDDEWCEPSCKHYVHLQCARSWIEQVSVKYFTWTYYPICHDYTNLAFKKGKMLFMSIIICANHPTSIVGSYEVSFTQCYL